MDQEWMTVKEEAILFARDKLEDVQEALWEVLPDEAEEIGFFREELLKQLQRVRGEMLQQVTNPAFAEDCP